MDLVVNLKLSIRFRFEIALVVVVHTDETIFSSRRIARSGWVYSKSIPIKRKINNQNLKKIGR